MLLGAKNSFLNISKQWVNPYVTDGLIAMWDGENNSSSGHDPSATTWKDLVGNMDLTLDGTSHFGENYIQTTDERSGAKADSVLNCSHIEWVFEITSIPNYWFTVFSNVNGVWYWGNGDTNGKVNTLYLDRYFGVDKGPGVASVSYSIEGNLYYNNLEIRNQYDPYYEEGVGPFRIFGGADWEDDPDTYKGLIGKCYCVRAYNRILSNEERVLNYAIDKIRFNLP